MQKQGELHTEAPDDQPNRNTTDAGESVHITQSYTGEIKSTILVHDTHMSWALTQSTIPKLRQTPVQHVEVSSLSQD